jgi:hypothetical protein
LQISSASSRGEGSSCVFFGIAHLAVELRS